MRRLVIFPQDEARSLSSFLSLLQQVLLGNQVHERMIGKPRRSMFLSERKKGFIQGLGFWRTKSSELIKYETITQVHFCG